MDIAFQSADVILLNAPLRVKILDTFPPELMHPVMTLRKNQPPCISNNRLKIRFQTCLLGLIFEQVLSVLNCEQIPTQMPKAGYCWSQGLWEVHMGVCLFVCHTLSLYRLNYKGKNIFHSNDQFRHTTCLLG